MDKVLHHVFDKIEPTLKNSKNLLAFSAGVDSSALFFLLLEHNIKFDIAIVDYGVREQSKKEVMHAKALARQYKLFCHDVKAPQFESHFEEKARTFRYEFFDALVTAEGYDNLLTAHQLNDQLEWFLMRLTKGAGVSELLGLDPCSQRKNYTLVRPLLEHSKQELLSYLQSHHYPYFIDESNNDEKYERNQFRAQFSNALLTHYKEGIQRSFHYLKEDKALLTSQFQILFNEKLLYIIKLSTPKIKAKASDMILKQLGYLLSASQRKEISHKESLVIGGLWAIEQKNDLLYIAPYLKTEMTKAFKEACRISKIPSKIRPYLFKEKITLPIVK
jgi:tRNA(Ile)-lysidine synthase